MKKLVTCVMSANIVLDVDSLDDAQALVSNDPETRAMAAEALSRSGIEVTDIQDCDD